MNYVEGKGSYKIFADGSVALILPPKNFGPDYCWLPQEIAERINCDLNDREVTILNGDQELLVTSAITYSGGDVLLLVIDKKVIKGRTSKGEYILAVFMAGMGAIFTYNIARFLWSFIGS